MLEQEKFSREEILKQIGINEETLSLYEHELEMAEDSASLDLYTKEDFNSVKLFHKLRESGLTYNEIKLLSSFTEVLKNVDFVEGQEKLTNLLSLSPVYRLKQSLNIARQEVALLKKQANELEQTLNREIELRASNGLETPGLREEMEAKQKALNTLDRKLSETLLQKTQLEAELILVKEGKKGIAPIKGKKAKELYQVVVQKDTEITELKTKIDNLNSQLEKSKENNLELNEKTELMEDEISEIEIEIEERYQDQISTLRQQIEGLIDKKQKEWEDFYVKSNDQHRKELLTLQRKHEQEFQRLKQIIKEKENELLELKAIRNPIAGLLRMGGRR